MRRARSVLSMSLTAFGLSGCASVSRDYLVSRCAYSEPAPAADPTGLTSRRPMSREIAEAQKALTWSYDADRDGAFDKAEWSRMQWETFWLGKGDEVYGAPAAKRTSRMGYLANFCGGAWTASCTNEGTRWFARKDSNCDGVVTYAEADILQWFRSNDRNRNGKVSATEIVGAPD